MPKRALSPFDKETVEIDLEVRVGITIMLSSMLPRLCVSRSRDIAVISRANAQRIHDRFIDDTRANFRLYRTAAMLLSKLMTEPIRSLSQVRDFGMGFNTAPPILAPQHRSIRENQSATENFESPSGVCVLSQRNNRAESNSQANRRHING